MEKIQKWKSQFMIVALGQAVSMSGSHGVQFALIWWLAEKTSSPLMLGIKIPKPEKAKREEQHFIAEIKEGLQVFKEDKKLFYIVIAEALCMFFYAPLSSFYPLMTSDYFKLSAMYGSAVELSFAIGMMVSSLLFSSVLKINRKIRISFVGLSGMGVMSLICGIIPPTYIGWFFFAGGCICLGASGNVHTIPLTAYMQETISPEKWGGHFRYLL